MIVHEERTSENVILQSKRRKGKKKKEKLFFTLLYVKSKVCHMALGYIACEFSLYTNLYTVYDIFFYYSFEKFFFPFSNWKMKKCKCVPYLNFIIIKTNKKGAYFFFINSLLKWFSKRMGLLGFQFRYMLCTVQYIENDQTKKYSSAYTKQRYMNNNVICAIRSRRVKIIIKNNTVGVGGGV